MSDRTPAHGPNDDVNLGPPPAPRWVKRLGVAVVVFLVFFGVLHATGHGLGRHMHGVDAQGAAPARGDR